MFRRLGEHGADLSAAKVDAVVGSGAVAGSGAGADQDAVGVDAAGQENADEPVDDSTSIQIILEPRMIEKNSVRVLGR